MSLDTTTNPRNDSLPPPAPPRVRLRSLYCETVNALLVRAGASASVAGAAGACARFGGLETWFWCVETIGLQSANFGVGIAGCLSAAAGISAACTYLGAKGVVLTAKALRKRLGCGSDGSDHIPDGVECSMLWDEDVLCESGTCSNDGIGRHHYCCPGKKPGDKADTYRGNDGMRYCTYKCVDGDDQKTMCISDDENEWKNLVEVVRKKETDEMCLFDSQCKSGKCSWTFTCT